MKHIIFSLFLISSAPVMATLPEYSAPELLARANIVDGHNLPPMSFLSNASPVINNIGDVVFKIIGSEGDNTQGIWAKLGSETNGKIVYKAPMERIIPDPSLNDQGKIAFNLYDEGVTDGIFVLDINTNEIDNVVKPESQELLYHTYSQVLANGKVYFRGTSHEDVRSIFEVESEIRSVISEGVTAFGQKASYLYKPSMNEAGSISFKRRLGEARQWDESQADEIVLLKLNGTSYESVVIAKDKDSDSNSQFKSFGNSTAISENGMVTFMATLEDGVRALMLYQDGILKMLAKEKSEDISELEVFSPKINDLGQVIFKAKNQNGKRGIYITDGVAIKRVIGEGDEVMTDLGMGKILSNPNYPGFAGEVDINDHGEFVFSCLIIGAKDNREWGSAVYKVSPLK